MFSVRASEIRERARKLPPKEELWVAFLSYVWLFVANQIIV